MLLKQKRKRFSFLLPLIGMICLPFLLWAGARSVSSETDAVAIENLQQSILRACIHCYAVEGRYPPSLSYLSENYRVYYDSARFEIAYLPHGSNLLPEITIIELGEGLIP